MSSPISFSGLVSGLDTKSIIQAMLQAYQAPIDMAKAQQANEQSKLQAYQDLNSKLQTLQAAASSLGLQATSGAKAVTFSGPNGTFASGTAMSNSVNGSFSLQVDQLATNTTATSTANVGGALALADTVTGNSKTGTPISTGSFTINGTAVSITAGETFATLFNDINTQTAGAVTASFAANNAVQLTSAAPITMGNVSDTTNFLAIAKLAGQPSNTTITGSGPLGVANATTVLDSSNIASLTSTPSGTFNINGVTINYNTAADSLNDVLNRINSSAANVTASYDPNSDKVTITSTKTGNQNITLADGTGNLLTQLNVTVAASHTLGLSAKYEVNGGPAQYSLTNTVSNVMPGVNLTFQAPTPSPVTVNVSQDSTVGSAAIQTFITAYNSVVDTIAQDTAFDPNTKSAGLFLGDGVIGDLQSQLDQGLFISNGQSLGLLSGFSTVSSIGISTGAVGSAPGTTTDLTFDPGKFQNALNTNPTAVTNMVTTIFGNFNKTLMNMVQPGGIIDAAVQSENAQIRDFSSQIADQTLLLNQQQDFLTQEFSALESQLAQLQASASTGAAALSSFTASQTAASNSSGNSTSSLLSSSASSGA